MVRVNNQLIGVCVSVNEKEQLLSKDSYENIVQWRGRKKKPL